MCSKRWGTLKTVVFTALLASSPSYALLWSGGSAQDVTSKKEPDSPQGHYYFSLQDIKMSTRQGVMAAENQIKMIETKGHLHQIAAIYFKDYLDSIAKYNDNYPQTIDIDEAFRTELVIAHTLKAFKTNHPKLIYDQSKWIFNTVGGIYANTIFLFCSPSEYIVIWGTSLRAYGRFSGYYPFMNEFDVMMRGKMYSHDVENHGHVQVEYRPIAQHGEINKNTVDTSNLKPSKVRSYSLEPYTYMVSYAQGNMIKAFGPGAIMPGIFVTQDFGGMWDHMKECALSYSLTDPAWMRPFKAIRNASTRVMSKIFNKSRTSQPGAAVPSNYRALEVVEAFYANLGSDDAMASSD